MKRIDPELEQLRQELLEQSKLKNRTETAAEMAEQVIQHMQLEGWRFAYENVDEVFARSPEHQGMIPVHAKSTELNSLLYAIYGAVMNPADKFWPWFIAALRQFITDPENAELYRRQVRKLAYFDEKSCGLYITDRVGGAYLVTPDSVEHLESCHVAFIDDARLTDGEPLKIERGLRPQGVDLFRDVLLDTIPFTSDPRAVLSPLEQAATCELWWYSLFFGSVQRERPILVTRGPAGAAKTTSNRSLGLVFFGPGFNVINLPTDVRGFDAVARHRRLLPLDNVEDYKGWLGQRLATVATGSNVEDRTYHTNADLYYASFDVNVIITAISPKLTAHDIVQRVLPLHLDRLETKKPTSALSDAATKNSPMIWGQIVEHLQGILKQLKATPGWRKDYSGGFRIADFAALARQMAVGLETERRFGVDVDDLIEKWPQAQTRFLVENDPLADLIESFLRSDRAQLENDTAREMFDKLHAFADSLNRFGNPQVKAALQSPSTLAPAIMQLAGRGGDRFDIRVLGKSHNAQRYSIKLAGETSDVEMAQQQAHDLAETLDRLDVKALQGASDFVRDLARTCAAEIGRHRRKKASVTPVHASAREQKRAGD